MKNNAFKIKQVNPIVIIDATFLTYSILKLARWMPERLQQVLEIEKYPGEENFALTDKNIAEWLLSHNIDLPVNIINEILEYGYKNAIFAKRHRKNEKGEVISLAYLLT